ncbi:DNA topoisomerase 2 [Massospora cicadina]|nr:DNA topoisomerase 2 [Massospora cicadina]
MLYYEQWCINPEKNVSTYEVEYYKGLATSTQKEGIGYFTNLTRHMIQFERMQDGKCLLIDLAFSIEKVDAHKKWLQKYCPSTYINQSIDSIIYTDFINKELIQFSMADNICSIPSKADGLNIIKKLAYHHGDQSLASTIISLAKDFVGANNINLLSPIGQFGSHDQGGKDAGAARSLSTHLLTIAQLLFHKDDMLLLNYLDGGIKVEPKWYVPVVPIILLNGCDGISTEWPTNIPNYNPVDMVSNLRQLMHCESPILMMPWYLGFTGDIEPSSTNHYMRFEITELPIRDRHLISDVIEDYEKHHSNLGMRYIIQILTNFYNIRLQFYQKCKEDLVSKIMQEYTKISKQARFIYTVIKKKFEICNIEHATKNKWLIEMAFDTINAKDDEGAIK